MRQETERAEYDGLGLKGLRNLPLEFYREDDDSLLPEPAPHRSVHDTEQIPTSLPAVELHYSSETTELGNESLPVYAYRNEILNAVKENSVTVIVAETGAGKSTQVPQFLLDAGWDNVYLTQPRRAAARNVFERIRSEISAVKGKPEGEALVSYQTAGEREGPADAGIKVVTDGLQLVRELNNSGSEKNDVLIIDEVHEWNANVEVLVAWVKRAIQEKPNLRVVIMSATMDADRLANYFGEVCVKTPPIVEVPGRTYHVERSEKPESTVVDEVLKAAQEIHTAGKKDRSESNGILVFEPGKREINDTIDEIRRRLPPDIARVATVLPLHAKLSIEEQQAAFRKYPGVKIIVATDVAQTSLTIPDVKYVIDSGYQRRMELDNEGAQGLVLHAISQADCDQRAGRAGRVSDGFYILTRLDAKTPHVPYIARDKYPLAEILRTDIIRNTLRIAGVGLDIASLDLYHPVEPHFIKQAQTTLHTLGALDKHNIITPIGKQMDQFPVRASSARMMVEAGRFSERTRAYMAAIVAAKEVGGLPYFAYNVGKEWKNLTEETSSDLLAQLDIFIAIQDMDEAEMKEHDLDLHNITRAREQYRKIAKYANALQETLAPPTPQEREDLKQCIYAGLITSVYKYNGNRTYIHVGNPDTPRHISNRSLVSGSPQIVVGDAYRVEYSANGGREVKHIIEHATAATLSDIGRIATHLTQWKSDGFTLRGGKFVDVRRLSLFDIDLGMSEERVAQPSPQLRETIIAHVLENAGPQQSKLRALKKQLEELAHRAKDHVPQLTHDQMVELVKEATPDDVTDPSVVDNNLRLIMLERGISLESFVSHERQERIAHSAPEMVTINDVKLRLTYRNKHPLVRRPNPRDIAQLKEEIFLEDGRQVYFVFDGRTSTLFELQEKLSVGSK
ncbi:MAG: hypothetical protein JWL85_668 [Candidatus Saccharibacteria bacterium]|nr:hypothetical protein [Candidatus Saccharibacteria bacterium]